MTFKLGIIGCGSIGNVHARNAAKAGVHVAGTWDIKVERAGEVAALHEECIAHPSVDELLASDVDAIAVAVPNHDHRECAIAALEAGKHVLLEKPMAISVAECEEIIAARDRSGARVDRG